MIRTILLDLDDTLLVNKMEQFLPAYFQRLGAYLAEIAPPERMLAELVAGTKAMLGNLDPRLPLEHVFSSYFYPALGLDQAETIGMIEDFYRNEFPTLEAQTQFIPGASKVVEELLAQGYEVVIATNPLFPRLAVEERLRWAGLPPAEVDFTLITSFEESHFAKPNPEYFAEILARLGRKPLEAIMVGDDLERDIYPAQALGLAVYYTGDELDARTVERSAGSGEDAPEETPVAALGLTVGTAGAGQNPCVMSGPLAGLQFALTSSIFSGDASELAAPRILLARLRAALAATLNATADLPADGWTSRPAEGEWAPVEIIAHLRDVELEVNRPRLQAVLTGDDPHLPAYDTDRWATERAYLEQDGPAVLEAFTQARMDTIEALSALDMQSWERPARHTLLGPTTLRELMKIASEHDWLHMAQLRETLETLRKQRAR